MSQYPVTTSDGLYSAVNYLLSGPAGLGQNFQGFSAYLPAYVKGTFKQPFTISTTATTSAPTWTVAPIAVTSATVLNPDNTNSSRNYEIFFTPQAQQVFFPGDTVDPEGIVDNPNTGNFNGKATVLSATTSSVIFQTSGIYQFGTYVSGGTIQKSNLNTFVSTDANARVTVEGPTQLVFITAQLNLEFTYTCSTSSQIDLVIAINRYIPSSNAPLAQGTDYSFILDKIISQQVYTYSTTSSGSINVGPTIFTTVLDQPSFGYYWYICEISFNNSDQNGNFYPGDFAPGTVTAGIRSLTAQVIKQ